MCDFLLLNLDNWMDLLTPTEVAEYGYKYPKTWDYKYNARNRRYDILRVTKNGGLDGYIGSSKFIIVKVPNLSLAEGKKLTGPRVSYSGVDPDGNAILRFENKHQFRLKYDSLPSAIKTALSQSNVYTVSNFEAFKDYIGTKGIDI
jgi:hypothetical protein